MFLVIKLSKDCNITYSNFSVRHIEKNHMGILVVKGLYLLILEDTCDGLVLFLHGVAVIRAKKESIYVMTRLIIHFQYAKNGSETVLFQPILISAVV